MTYLIAQIWLFIAVAAVIGLLFGWMFRGGVSAARLRELHHKLAHSQAEAADQRREAAELAARAERHVASGGPVGAAPDDSKLREAQEHIARLESELRSTTNDADRFEEETEELRRRLAELSGRPLPPAADDESEALRARVRELEDEGGLLRRKLDEMERASDVEPYRTRISELEYELDAARTELAERSATPAPVVDEGATAALHAEIDRLQGELAAREADAAELDRLRAQSEELAGLRAQVAELEGLRGQAEEAEGLRVQMEELAGLRAQAEEIPRLRAQVEELEAARGRSGELERELETSRASLRASEERLRALEEARAAEPEETVPHNGARVEDLQTESARLRWRNSYLTSRIHFLESKLRDEAKAAASGGGMANDAAREEIERLNARIAELEASHPLADRSHEPAPNVEGGGGSLEWRNRYLASRVRYLEQQIEEKSDGGVSASEDELRMRLAEAEAEAEEVAKLRARVLELERSVKEPNGEDESGAKSEAEFALEWRNRYLSSRVKYLEERLSKAGVQVDPNERGDAR